MTFVLSRKPEVGIGQPSGDLVLDRSHPLTKGLILSIYNAASDMEKPPRNYVDGAYGSRAHVGSSGGLVAANTWQAINPAGPEGTQSGNRTKILNAAKFNGTTSWAFIPLDISPYDFVTVAFWMQILANTNTVTFEYTTNYLSNNGFVIGPWGTDGTNTGPYNIMGYSGTFQLLTSIAPPLKEVHHYMMVFNRQGGQGTLTAPWYEDGCKTSPHGFGSPAIPTPFAANGGFNIGARNKGETGFANICIACVQVWNYKLTAADAADYFRNTWQIFRPAVCSVGETS